ncbi:hypothetical protein HNQ77_001941 [Silvibacterium bohemicum]|uniref:DUF2934 domain-containing protein n=1 Tax=Silvibacterium bohemicum TaxID=1577686 RepID=A0A841JRH5_9BACT|nr:DUF2934 domain-containing protein [Silvibacterium bohemicum]MBB6143992.1 hypothetical protein [Silvibacterium bohemicum]
MADKEKKAKAPAKPRKTAEKAVETKAIKKDNVEEIKAAPSFVEPTREEITELARKYWAERGWQDGFAEQDWLRAEQELRGMAS